MGRFAKAARNVGWGYAGLLVGWAPAGLLHRYGSVSQLWLIPLLVAGPLLAWAWLYRKRLLVALRRPEFRRPRWKRLEGVSIVTIPAAVAAGVAIGGNLVFGQSVPLAAFAAGVLTWVAMWRRRRRATIRTRLAHRARPS